MTNSPKDNGFRLVSPGRGDIPGMWEHWDGKAWRIVTDEDLRRGLDWKRKEQGGDNGPVVVREYESSEFHAVSIIENGEWVELDGTVYFHPECKWIRSEVPTM